jgi:flagellar protein FliO/FliZ
VAGVVQHITFWSTIGFGTVGQILYIFLITGFVALLAWFCIRLMGGRRMGRSSGRNLEIIEAIALGNQATMQLVRAGKKYLVIAVTRAQVTILGELNSDEVTIMEQQSFAGTPFSKVLERFMPGQSKKDDEDEAAE